MTDLPDYDIAFRGAVKDFWGVRKTQQEAQALKGATDAGTRGAVTGGKHLDPLQDVVLAVLGDSGIPTNWLHTGREAAVPGWFRERKAFDIVASDGRRLFATVELKSQVGSFGNNQNNRIEEAIGQALDHHVAGTKGLLPGLAPWFGYVLLIESTGDSMRARGTASGKAVVPVDPVYKGLSYVDRYIEAFKRMTEEKLVDAACVAITSRPEATVAYPSQAMSFQSFAVALDNRVRAVRAAGYL